MAERMTWFSKFSDVVNEMPEDRRWWFAEKVMAYGMSGVEPCFEWPYSMAFAAIREDIDNSNARRENGSKGGRPKKAEAKTESGEPGQGSGRETEENLKNLAKPEKPETENETPYHSIPIHTNPIQSIEAGAKRKRFAPPSAREVDAYMRERGTPIDAERFCDFYASKGWRVGSAPMKDWRAAARGWASRDANGKGASGHATVPVNAAKYA
ncbi:hypothetical protein GMI70_02940 [Eggerthellaceae bacterium zg-893]|nr:hypothetical protein [Eggerthellaceae bacterium zg-893]